jgi:hypothetical protein
MKYRVVHEVSTVLTPRRILTWAVVIYLAGIATALIAIASH